MSQTTLKSLSHCVYNIRYHLVLVTKYRNPVIDSEILSRLKTLTRERVEDWGGDLYEMTGEPDHVHILFDLPPHRAIADFVNALKTGTSRRIRNEYPDQVSRHYWKPVFWSRSYCVVTAGGAPLDTIKHYIQNQKGT